MQIIRTIREMQKWSMDRKKEGKTVAVVPTMGFLHEGHLSLIDAARAAGADAVVVTIFVNPIQFAPNEDFDRGLCAKTRPTHFNGVTTVVAKLFNATLPDIAVFGQKDAQQARVLKRMVRDLNFPIRMVIAPIVREADGLAKSSRNKYLSPEERGRALVLSRSLRAAKAMAEAGEKDTAKLTAFISKEIEAAGGKVDYVESVDAEDLEPCPVKGEKPLMIALAAWFGTTRLIDNIVF